MLLHDSLLICYSTVNAHLHDLELNEYYIISNHQQQTIPPPHPISHATRTNPTMSAGHSPIAADAAPCPHRDPDAQLAMRFHTNLDLDISATPQLNAFTILSKCAFCPQSFPSYPDYKRHYVRRPTLNTRTLASIARSHSV